VTRSGPARKGSTVQITALGEQVAEDVRASRNRLLAQRMTELTPREREALEAALPVFDKMFGPPLSPPRP
jgi:predicted MarR family transcription regulator